MVQLQQKRLARHGIFHDKHCGITSNSYIFAGGTTMPKHPTLRTNLQGLTLTIPSYSNPADSQVGRWDDLATTHPPALRSNLTCCEQHLLRWSPFEGDWPFHASRLCSLWNNSQLTVAWLLLYGITALGNTCTVRRTFCNPWCCLLRTVWGWHSPVDCIVVAGQLLGDQVHDLISFLSSDAQA